MAPEAGARVPGRVFVRVRTSRPARGRRQSPSTKRALEGSAAKQGGLKSAAGKPRAASALRERPAARPKLAGPAAAEAPPGRRGLRPGRRPGGLATGVQTLVVEPDEADMRVDRFLVARFPQLAFTHIQRIVRKGELRIDGKRAQAERPAGRGPENAHPALKLDQPRPVSRSAGQGPGRPRIPEVDHALRGQGRPHHQQAHGARGAGRIGHQAARGRHPRGARGRRGAEAASRAPARQGHGRLPRHRQDALCRLDHGEILPLAHHAQDLLGARRRRAARAAGQGLDLSGQGRRRGRFPHARRPARRRGCEPRADLLCRRSIPRRRSSPGCR